MSREDIPGYPVVGAHNVGSMVPVFVDNTEANRHRERDELVVTDERCDSCAWPDVCEEDRTCWHENRRRARSR